MKRFLVVLIAGMVIGGCGKKVDDFESAAEVLKEMSENKVKPRFNENTHLANINLQPVSYTHLTLPTILRV